MRMKGIIANLLTPLAENKTDLCQASLESLLNFLLFENVCNLWVMGSAGEDFSLSRETKCEIIKFFDKSKLPFKNVVIGISTNAPSDEDYLLSNLNDYSSIHGFHFLCYDQKLGDYQYLKRIESLANKLQKPLYLYHNPKRGKPLNLSIVKSLSGIPNIGGIKIGGYSFDEMSNFKEASPSSWNSFCAGGSQIIDCLSLGFKAHSTSDANIFPRIFTHIFSLVSQGQIDEARQYQHLASAFSNMIPRNNNGEYSAEEKYILYKRGILKSETVNETYDTLSDSQKLLTSNVDKIYNSIFK